jgi:hypothetical protein
MEKRAFERILTFFSVKLLCKNSLHDGIVTNLSQNGMCIETNGSFCSESNLEVLIPLSDEDFLKFPVKFQRIVETNGFFGSICVEVLNPPNNYLDFVDSRRTAHNDKDCCFCKKKCVRKRHYHADTIGSL